jgi:beta-glucosidase-like glycosyl hydrolase
MTQSQKVFRGLHTTSPVRRAHAGTAYVQGLQSGGIVATLKHFAGYSASTAGRNHAPVPMGRRELKDMILPPFEMAIREGAAGLGHELLLRHRRRAGRCQPRAAHDGAA